MEKQKIYNILNVFLENYDENDLKKQNKQINLLIEEINHLEKENSNEIVALNNNENIIKKGMLLKIGDILYCLNDFKYEKENSNSIFSNASFIASPKWQELHLRQ